MALTYSSIQKNLKLDWRTDLCLGSELSIAHTARIIPVLPRISKWNGCSNHSPQKTGCDSQPGLNHHLLKEYWQKFLSPRWSYSCLGATSGELKRGYVLCSCKCSTWLEIQYMLSLHFSRSVVCDSLQPHGLQHVRLPCPSPLPEPTQTHVHQVGDAIQPSHPLLSPSPPAFNLSQHQGLFQWVSSSHQVAKVLEFQLQHQSFQ